MLVGFLDRRYGSAKCSLCVWRVCLCQQRLYMQPVKNVNIICVSARSRQTKSRLSLVRRTELLFTLYAAMKAQKGE
jgi:hypothetical protein